MAYGFDIEALIKAILEKISESAILIILYTNSKSLYGYLVKIRHYLGKAIDDRHVELISVMWATWD